MEAQRSCRSLDMDLVSIHDEAEMNHVVSVMSQEDENVGRIWIGFTRLKTFSPSIKSESIYKITIYPEFLIDYPSLFN